MKGDRMKWRPGDQPLNYHERKFLRAVAWMAFFLLLALLNHLFGWFKTPVPAPHSQTIPGATKQRQGG